MEVPRHVLGVAEADSAYGKEFQVLIEESQMNFRVPFELSARCNKVKLSELEFKRPRRLGLFFIALWHTVLGGWLANLWKNSKIFALVGGECNKLNFSAFQLEFPASSAHYPTAEMAEEATG
jgi:hypothetical protein